MHKMCPENEIKITSLVRDLGSGLFFYFPAIIFIFVFAIVSC